MTSLFNHIRRFAEEMAQQSKNQQAFNFFDDCIKEIYEGKISNVQIANVIKKLNLDIGYGSLYTVIRQRLQKVCKNHRLLINNSASVFAKSNSNYYRANTPPTSETEQQNLKIYETLSCIIYYNFQALANANKLVCQLWDAYKDQEGQQSKIQSSIKMPQLKLSTLNLLALKQLIPTSEHILLKLKNSIYVTKKDYIQQMLEVYGNEPASEIKNQIKNNSQTKIAQNKNEGQNKNNIANKNGVQNKTGGQIKTIAQPSQLNENKELLKFLNEQTEEKKKTILQKYSTNFGDFCIFQDVQDEKKEKNIIEELAMKSFLNISINGQGGTQLRIIKSTYQIKLSQNSQGIQIIQKNQQSSPSKKKKRKNKKKKGKQVQSDQEQQNKKQRQHFFQNKEQFKQCSQTIKFLQQLTIDDEKRVNCKMKEVRNLEDWKKWASINIIQNN